MRTRLDLHELLCELVESRHVYFSPPASIQMMYPCIVYEVIGCQNDYADNLKYRNHRRWSVTYITTDPDDTVHNRLDELQYSNPGNPFVADGLYHFPYTIYF